MRRSAGTAILLAFLTVTVLAGCNTMGRQPRLKDAAIAPNELAPGETAVVSVTAKDRHGIVSKVEGVVREDPSITFKLRDDGLPPDEKAGDGVWSLQVDVPFQAPPGEYLFELTAYRSDGTAVPVRDPEGGTAPLAASVPVIIRSP